MMLGQEQRDQSVAMAVTFSVTATRKNGDQGSFRDTILNLQSTELGDCFISLFHLGDSYALLSGEALPAAHTTSNAELRAYLLGRFSGDDTGLDFDVKIDRRTECARFPGS
jgi:hypothetical protein